jgi:hypothetical protein
VQKELVRIRETSGHEGASATRARGFRVTSNNAGAQSEEEVSVAGFGITAAQLYRPGLRARELRGWGITKAGSNAWKVRVKVSLTREKDIRERQKQGDLQKEEEVSVDVSGTIDSRLSLLGFRESVPTGSENFRET